MVCWLCAVKRACHCSPIAILGCLTQTPVQKEILGHGWIASVSRGILMGDDLNVPSTFILSTM